MEEKKFRKLIKALNDFNLSELTPHQLKRLDKEMAKRYSSIHHHLRQLSYIKNHFNKNAED